METKLFVGNLSYNTTEDDLRTLFIQAGTVVSVTLIKDRDTGRSRGFAFVEMSTQAESQQAISLFDGTQMDERTLRINFARPREEAPRGGGGGYGGGGGGYGGGGGGYNKSGGKSQRPRGNGPRRY